MVGVVALERRLGMRRVGILNNLKFGECGSVGMCELYVVGGYGCRIVGMMGYECCMVRKARRRSALRSIDGAKGSPPSNKGIV